jgi:peptidoglycan hydrolase-like protein with peptidoglycan-binding domain/stage V sporulation protein SpoVS
MEEDLEEREHEHEHEEGSARAEPPRFSRALRGARASGRAAEVSGVLSSAIRKARGAIGVAADWVEENPIATVVFVGVAMLLLSRRRACAPVAGYMTAGVWADLAAQTGRQSRPPWIPSGIDLDVKTAQLYLNRLTGSHLAVDGILGPKTSAALRSFQAHNGIAPSGTIDAETSGALEYLFFAASPNPKLKAAAAMSPESIAKLGPGPVTYAPYPMPPLTSYAPTYGAAPAYPYQGAPGYPAEGGLPGELASVVRYYQALSQMPPVLGPRTGIQSTSMSDVRYHYDVPGHFEDWGPGPGGSWG